VVDTDSSTVKCLSSHLSSFAVVAENVKLIEQIIYNATATSPTTPTSEPPTCMSYAIHCYHECLF